MKQPGNKLTHKIRYAFEHRLLPHLFYDGKLQFMGKFSRGKELLFFIIDDMFKDQKAKNPYTQEDFDTAPFRITDDILVLKIIFPEPEDEPLCYCSYVFYNTKTENGIYFCIEKGRPDDIDQAFVCCWTPDGTHEDYDKCPLNKNQDLLRCVQIYIDRFPEEFSQHKDME